MAEDSDDSLLGAYVRDRCEASFNELVHRYVDLVHSTALRIVRDAGLAEDVTQRVFLALARHAAKLLGRTSLAGWLHETSRHLAINTVRGEERRRQREQEAASMNEVNSNDSAVLWQRLAPCLDDAVAQLSAAERDVILWRYFERRTAEQIGGRLGLTSEAAQKRVARAMERLRKILAERGLTTTTAGLAAVLTTEAVQAAPVGLAATAIAAAGSAAVVLPGISTLQIIMASTKAKMGLAIVLAASATTPIVLQHQTNSQLRDENARLRAELANPPAVQSAAVDVSELERLRGEHNELLRLRGQVAQYRQQLANLPKTSVVAGRGPGKADDLEESEREEAKALLEKSPEIPMIQASEFRNMGYSTAENSFHTMNWATSRRDTNAALGAIGLEPAARARADDLFLKMPEAVQQRYGSVDALLMDWMMTHAEPPVAYRILAQSAQGENLATLTVQFQYPNFRVRENELSYYRDPTGAWRIAMPAGVMDKLPGVAESLMHGSTAPGSSGK